VTRNRADGHPDETAPEDGPRTAGPPASVIIPAHNEARVLPRLLTSLDAGVRDGRWRVFVVCNGCTDDTAQVARSFPGVEVLQTPDPLKTHALNLGDEAAGDLFPRLYLDADIGVDTASLDRVVATLSVPQARAAAPALHFDTTDRPLVVRWFYTVFAQTWWVTDGLLGSGFYGLSREGRARFGRFPNRLNEDQFVRELFDRDERFTPDGARFVVATPRTTGALVRAKARVAEGVAELAEDPDHRPVPSQLRPRPVLQDARELAGIARRPGMALPVLTYAGVRVTCWLLKSWRLARGRRGTWSQDRTTRTAIV
jgi:Glycosyl transferase family 2